MGGTVDYEMVWDPATVQHLADRWQVASHELDTSRAVRSERDLLCSALGFLRSGRGGERFVESPETVREFAAHFAPRVTVGGTCVRAALALARLGIASTVHLVSIDGEVRQALPPLVSWVSSGDEDASYPHLIVQYPAGARVRLGDGVVTAPCANRLIYVNDPANRELRISDALGERLRTAAVFLVSGFNSMREQAVLEDRLDRLETHLRQLPPDALVVYEDGEFHVPELSAVVRSRLLPHIDVYGLNEDELQSHLGRSLSLHDPGEMGSALAELRALIPGPVLVLHTRTYALAVGPDAARFAPALESAVRTAAARYVRGDDFTAGDVQVLLSSPRNPEGERFSSEVVAAAGYEIGCVPAYALDTPTPTTIGLGDTFVGGFLAALV